MSAFVWLIFSEILAFFTFLSTFSCGWNNFWLKGATPPKIGEKTSQTIKIILRKIQGCSSYTKKLRAKAKGGGCFWHPSIPDKVKQIVSAIKVHQVQFI